LPSEVDIWCHRCKNLAITKKGSSMTDSNPRWTIGVPLYVKGRRLCLRCQDTVLCGRYEVTDFEPVDPSIKSINLRRLSQFHLRYGAFGTAAHTVLLDENFACSRQHKKAAKFEKDSVGHRYERGFLAGCLNFVAMESQPS